MSKTVLNKKELAERWGVDISTLEAYEKEGYIKRINLPGAKFSLSSIEKIEYDGIDNLIIKKDHEILRLQLELEDKINLINKIQVLINL